MSADNGLLPVPANSVPAPSNAHLGLDAVDAYEITARLEASGVSDRTARRRYGAADVFDYAQSLVQVRESARIPQAPESWLNRDAALDAVRRAIVLILGAVLGGLTATVLAVDTNGILVAGIGAWVIGQAVSGIVWAHTGAGHLKRGIAKGTGAAVLVGTVLACYMVLSLALPGHEATIAGLILAWCWYSCVVSMLVIIGRSWYLLTVLSCAVAVMTLTLVVGHGAATTIVLTVAILVVLAVTLALVGVLRTIDDKYIPSRGDWGAAISPATQAGFLAAALGMALTRLPAGEGTALIVATVIAAAATDPALVLMRQRLLWSSTRTPLLRHAAKHAWTITMVMSAAIVVVSASVSTLVVMFLVDDATTTTVIVAAAFSSLATTSTTLNAFGLPRGGVVFAGGACLSALGWVLAGNLLGVLLAVAFLVAGIVVLLARVSDPRAYA